MNNSKKTIVRIAVFTIVVSLAVGVIVALASLGFFRLEQRALTIRSDSLSVVYSGVSVDLEDTYEMTAGTLAAGDVLSVQMTANVKNVGTYENTFSVVVTDKHGRDVTDTYTLEYEYGEVRVLPCPVTFYSGSAVKTYDATPLTCGDGALSGGTICAGQKWQIGMTGAQTDAGSSENTFYVVITDQTTGKDETSNYDITYEPGTLTVLPVSLAFFSGSAEKEYDGTPLQSLYVVLKSGEVCHGQDWFADVSGSQIDVGSSDNVFTVVIQDEATGKDVTGNYDITYEPGTLTVLPVSVTFSSGTAEKEYDGTPLTCDEALLKEGRVMLTHRWSAVFTGEQTDAGNSNNDFTVIVQDVITGKDVTDNYEITYEPGTLTVLPVSVTFSSGSAEKEYDGTPLTCDEALLKEGRVMLNHKWSAVFTGEQTDVGSSANLFTMIITDGTGKDVTQNYDVTYNPGVLTVLPITLTFSSGSAEKEYDGTPLTCDEAFLTSGSLCLGHQYKVDVTGQQTTVGHSDNVFSVVITDATGKDVTVNYTVIKQEGVLLVTPIYVTFLSGSAQKVYDGEPLTNDEVTLVSGHLTETHSLDVDVTGSQTEVGTSDNTFGVRIVDADGNDVSDCYRISLACGTLAVLEPSGGGGGGDSGDDGSGGEGKGDDGEGSGGGGGDEFSYRVITDYDGVLYLREMNYGSTYNYYNFDDPEAWYGETTSPMVYAGNAMKNSGAAVGHCTVYMPKANASIVYRIMPYYLVDGNEDETSDVLHMVSRDTSYSYTCVPYTYDGGTVQGKLTGTMAAEEEEYRDWVYDNYLNVPESTAQVFRQLAAENGLSADSPTIVNDVIQYIKHAAEYNLLYEPEPKNVDRAVYFLTQSKEGICQHYAVAATLMFRILGIPARYVQGYMVSVKANIMTKVTGNMGHAWTEIYVDGIGWMQVDATADGDSESSETSDDYSTLRAAAELTFKTNSASKIYDGQPFEGLTCECIGTLVQGDYIAGYVTDSTADVGVYPNKTVPIILDKYGNNVTNEYVLVTWDCGSLTISPATITVQTGAAAKAYDGIPLSCAVYTIVSGKLAAGDVITVSAVTERTERGTEPNKLKIVVMCGNRDVTANYAIQQLYGTLTVTQ